jgi:hypothetical protein
MQAPVLLGRHAVLGERVTRGASDSSSINVFAPGSATNLKKELHMREMRSLALAIAVAFVPLFILLISGRAVTASVPRGETGFLLGGTAQNAVDPENPLNQVIKIDTTSPPECSPAGSYQHCRAGEVSRKLNVQIAALDNMLEFKSYFQKRTCGGGSPRMQLAIDLDGNGTSDGNAFVYTNPIAGCAPNRWQYDDLTDEVPRWDLTQFWCSLMHPQPCIPPGSYVEPYAVAKTVLTTLFPNHKICSGALIDDSGWDPATAGVAYYDIISLFRATWEEWEDSVGRGFAQGCGKPDDGDFDIDGDHNHDHSVDDCDRDWHERHGAK